MRHPCRGVQLGLLVAGLLLVLHLFMLAGGHAVPVPAHAEHGMPVSIMPMPDAASAVDRPMQGHDMLATCLAVGVGFVLLGLASTVRRREGPGSTADQRWSMSVTCPPTPPPIALGISRT